MCLTSIGVVVALDGGEAVVDLAGMQRRAFAWTVPDLQPGDIVLVGLGTILGRVDEADRAVLERLEPPPSIRLTTS